ncbi:MAG: YbhN family protein [Halorhabdus sp.]
MENRQATIAGFAGATAVLAVLFWFVGVGEIIEALRQAELPFLVAVVVFAGLWLCSWGMALHTVLGALDHPIRARSAILVFSAAVFANNVTPFGQAGGEPVSALLISEAADSDYETGLAAIASVDTLHFVPSIGLATVGLGAFAIRIASLGRNLLFAAVAVGLLATAFLAGALVGWRYRYELERVVVSVFTPIVQRLLGSVPRLEPPTASDIEQRIEGFFQSIDRVASNRRTLLVASLYSTMGWLSLSTALWLSLAAIGHVVPFIVPLAVVPVASIAAITPLPGGLGGIETVFIALLVSTTGIVGSVAGAAVVIYRVATFWFPVVLGGSVAAMLGTRRRRSL